MILAMGAEHTNTENLQRIINGICLRQCKNNWYKDNLDNLLKYESKYQKSDINQHIFSQDYIIEEKYDGYSYLNIEGKFFSKSLSQAKGNEGQPVEKTNHIPHISNILKTVFEVTGCDLHGELYVPNGISDDVTKILGCTEEKAIKRTQENYENRIRYRLIDIRAYKGHILINEPYVIRRSILEYLYYNYIKPIDKENNIDLSEILEEDPRQAFARIVTNGGEGLIIKSTSGLYVPGKKPAGNWIKVKKKITVDVVIMGYNRGTGKNASMFGSIEVGMYIDGKLQSCGNVSSGISDEIRKMIADDPEFYLNQVIEIEAIQESAKSFRNAVFIKLRDDKHATECVPMNINIKLDI